MKFEKVKDLIEYLEQFNPNAEILTDMMFSWVKPQFQESSEEDKRNTNILYVYGEYNPYYEENKNYYVIKDFLIYNYFDEYYDFCSCYLNFIDEEDSPRVEYHLKHKNYWSFEKTEEIELRILEELYIFCLEKDMVDEYENIILFITQELFE